MLHEPVLLVMLTGWIDAAGAGATAAAVVSTECETVPLVRFDDDTFIDYRARRPTMELRDGLNTDLDLADDRTAFRTLDRRSRHPAAHGPGTGHGVAPLRRRRLRHRRATRRHADGRVRRLSLRHASHPSAAPVVFVTVDRRARQRHVRPQLDRRPRRRWRPHSNTPCTRGRSPRSGIWAQVPHYVAAMAYPAASVALLDGLDRGHRHHDPGDRPARRRRRSSASGSTSRSATTPTTSRCCASSRRSTTPPTARRRARARADRRARPRDAVRRRTRRRDPTLPQRAGLTDAGLHGWPSTANCTVRRVMKIDGSIGTDLAQRRAPTRVKPKPPATPASGRPRRRTTRSCRCCSPRSTPRSWNSARRSPSPSPARR